jgi:hypothetical protein
MQKLESFISQQRFKKVALNALLAMLAFLALSFGYQFWQQLATINFYTSQGVKLDLAIILSQRTVASSTLPGALNNATEQDQRQLLINELNSTKVLASKATTITVPKFGHNAGMLVGSISTPNSPFWKALKDDGVGYVLAIATSPADVAAAAKVVNIAYDNEITPIIRLCYNEVGAGCGFGASTIELTAARIGKFFIDVYKESGKKSFIAVIINEPATECKVFINGCKDPATGKDWDDLARMIKGTFTYIRSKKEENGYRAIRISPFTMNASNSQADEAANLLTKISKTDSGRCWQWDIFTINTYQFKNSNLNPSLNMYYQYIKGPKGYGQGDTSKNVLPNSIASVARSCGIPVGFTEMGIYREGEEQTNCQVENFLKGFGFDRWAVIENFTGTFDDIMELKEVEFGLFFRTKADIEKQFFPGQEFETGQTATDCKHTMTDPELRYITAPQGGDSDKNNNYTMCTYQFRYDARARYQTANFRFTQESSRSDLAVLDVVLAQDAKSAGSSGYTTFQLDLPIKALASTSQLHSSQRNQFFSLPAIATLIGGGFSNVEGVDPDLKKVTTDVTQAPVDFTAQVAAPAKVAGKDYAIPWLETARNASEYLKTQFAIDNQYEFFNVKNQYERLSVGQYVKNTFKLGEHPAFPATEAVGGTAPLNQTVKVCVHEPGVDGCKSVRYVNSDPQLRQYTRNDPTKRFSTLTADRYKLINDPSGAQVLVENPDLMLPGPEKRYATMSQNWPSQGHICWDNLYTNDAIIQPIYGDSLRNDCKWIGGPRNAQCRYIAYSGPGYTYLNNVNRLHVGFDKSKCYEFYDGNKVFARRLEAEFPVEDLNGNLQIEGLWDTAANLTRFLEQQLSQYIDKGQLRDLVLSYPKVALPIYMNITTRDNSRAETPVTDKNGGESFFYESDICKIPGGKTDYIEQEHQISRGKGNIKRKMVASPEFYYLNRLVEIMSNMYATGSTTAVINEPFIKDLSREDIEDYYMRIAAVANRQTSAECPDINGARMSPSVIAAEKSGQKVDLFDKYDCLIGWDSEERKDKNPWMEKLCSIDSGSYGDGQYIKGAKCGKAVTNNPGGEENICPVIPTQPGEGKPGVGGYCPLENAWCLYGPQVETHQGLNAVDLNSGSDNVIAPTDGAVVWAADGFAYDRCGTEGYRAGGAMIYQMSNGQRLFLYHVKVVPGMVKTYKAGEVITRVTRYGDPDLNTVSGIDSGGRYIIQNRCWSGKHVHVELARSSSPASINSDGPITDIMATLGCDMSRGKPSCRPKGVQIDMTQIAQDFNLTEQCVAEVVDKENTAPIGGACNEWNCGGGANKSFDKSLSCAAGISYYKNGLAEWVDKYGPFCDNETNFTVPKEDTDGDGLIDAQMPFAYNMTKFYDTYLPPGTAGGRTCAELPPAQTRVADKNMKCESYPNRVGTEPYNYYRGALVRCGLPQAQLGWTRDNTFGIDDPAKLADHLIGLNVNYYGRALKDAPKEKIVRVLEAAKRNNINPFFLLATWATETWFGQYPSCKAAS